MCRQAPHQKRHFWKTKRTLRIRNETFRLQVNTSPSSSITSPQAVLCSELQRRIMCLVSETTGLRRKWHANAKRHVRSEPSGLFFFFPEAGRTHKGNNESDKHADAHHWCKHQHQCILSNKAARCASKIKSSSVANPFKLVNSETVDINSPFLSTRLGKSVHQCPRPAGPWPAGLI